MPNKRITGLILAASVALTWMRLAHLTMWWLVQGQLGAFWPQGEPKCIFHISIYICVHTYCEGGDELGYPMIYNKHVCYPVDAL